MFVSLIDYCYCTEVKGVEVKFSNDFNFLHFRESKTGVSDICRFKKAERVKFRLNITEVVGILIGPKSFALLRFFKDNPKLKNETEAWKYISILTEE